MSHAAVAWAQQQRCGTPSAKAVLLALADHAGPDGVCWPSWSRIARITELSRSTVWRAIDHLRQIRLVILVRSGGGNNRKGVNVYRLAMTEPRWPAEVADDLDPQPGPTTPQAASLFDSDPSHDETGTDVLGSRGETVPVASRDGYGSRGETGTDVLGSRGETVPVASRDMTGRVTRPRTVREPLEEPDAQIQEAFPGSEFVTDDIAEASAEAEEARKAEAAVRVGALRALMAPNGGGATR